MSLLGADATHVHAHHRVKHFGQCPTVHQHFIIQELVAYIGYHHIDEQLSFWRTHTGIEVDAVIGDARIAIEIKSAEEIQPRHLKGLKSFGDDYPDSRRIMVSLDRINRHEGDIELIYVHDFLKMLWSGKIV